MTYVETDSKEQKQRPWYYRQFCDFLDLEFFCGFSWVQGTILGACINSFRNSPRTSLVWPLLTNSMDIFSLPKL